MEELLVDIEKIVEKVVENKVEKIVEEVVENKVEKIVDEKIKKANNELRDDLEGQIKAIGLKLEFDIERKIDIILDYITLQQEKDVENIRKIHQLEKRMEQNEIQILDHKNRIVVLEEKMINK